MRSVRLSPAEVQYNLGSICEQQGKRIEAKAYYEKALALDPKLRDARIRLAILNDPRAYRAPAASTGTPVEAPAATQPSAENSVGR